MVLGGGSEQLPASYSVCYLVQCLKLNNSVQSFFSNDFSEGRMTKQLAFTEWKTRSWLFLLEISFQSRLGYPDYRSGVPKTAPN